MQLVSCYFVHLLNNNTWNDQSVCGLFVNINKRNNPFLHIIVKVKKRRIVVISTFFNNWQKAQLNIILNTNKRNIHWQRIINSKNQVFELFAILDV